MQMQVMSDGPVDAQIMIVGEAPGADETLSGKPFTGASGQELSRMLHEAGIMRAECFLTNVCRIRPPDNKIEYFIPEKKKDVTSDCTLLMDKMVKPPVLVGHQLLMQEVQLVKPKVILAMGNVALWSLTGKWGITKWRGSTLKATVAGHDCIVIPVLHPAYILRAWEQRFITVHDLRRAARVRDEGLAVPQYRFLIRPTFQQTIECLEGLLSKLETSTSPVWISSDIETRRKHTSCVGLAWSRLDAICIPFVSVARKEYWTLDEEVEIQWLLYKVQTHPNAFIIGQNFLYDAQYFSVWNGYIPRVKHDTMLSHHVLFPGTPKGLADQASLYCDYYVYWKDEGKELDTSEGEDAAWYYNCKDAVNTFEIAEEQLPAVEKLGLTEVHEFQQSLFWPVLDTMLFGVKPDLQRKAALGMELMDEIAKREQWFIDVLGHPLNPRSPKQMAQLFYEDFQQKPIISRKTKRPTLDDAALNTIATREPLLRALVDGIADYRTLGVFLSTFVEADLDIDGRIRCSFNPAGAETFRLSSSENAFGSGMNLQNVPSDKSKSVGKFIARAKRQETPFELPNIRAMFMPDYGCRLFDCDLDRADLQVVVWEADDEEMKIALREGLDMHLLSAGSVFNLPIRIEDLRDPDKVKDFKVRYATLREFAKVFVHGTNYGGSARTMAQHVGVTVAEAERAQAAWFYAHPGIKGWHRRIEEQLMMSRCVYNKFGYRRFYFDRVQEILPEALGWIPQSTVAVVINRGWKKIYDTLSKDVQILIQVHDSLVGQFEDWRTPELTPKILECLKITIPYDDPLTIPVGMKTSTVSWGDVKGD